MSVIPEATFVPDHGPIATTQDLLRHAAYVTFLDKSAAGSHADGLDESNTAQISRW